MLWFYIENCVYVGRWFVWVYVKWFFDFRVNREKEKNCLILKCLWIDNMVSKISYMVSILSDFE